MRVLSSKKDSITEKLVHLITDDTNVVISSFELNQIASLTYHESQHSGAGPQRTPIHDEMTQVLENILSKPRQSSTLSLQKALAITKHVLLFGSIEKALPSCRFLQTHIEDLSQNYNTVLMALQQPDQQKTNTVSSLFLRIKGGDVDRGGPVREAASEVLELLQNPTFLQSERQRVADPQSLVPVGDTQTPAFLTDEVRLKLLQRQMKVQQEQLNLQKSNLQKSEGAFGAGYNARDGSQVVGAAHGLDEMIQAAQRQQQREQSRFSDEGGNTGSTTHAPFSSYQPPSNDFLSSTSFATKQQDAPAPVVDLLDFGNEAISVSKAVVPDLLEGDLLGTTGALPAAASEGDLLGTAAGNSDMFLFGSTSNTANSTDLFGAGGPTVASNTPSYTMTTGIGLVDASAGAATPMISRTSNPVDKYSALDSLSIQNDTKQNTLNDFSDLKYALPSANFTVSTSGIQVSNVGGAGISMSNEDDDDNPFVMGGSSGTGINGPSPLFAPMGAAPASAPPPPPDVALLSPVTAPPAAPPPPPFPPLDDRGLAPQGAAPAAPPPPTPY